MQARVLGSPARFRGAAAAEFESCLGEGGSAGVPRRHGGTRPISPDSKHHGIKRKRVEEWHDRWDLLGLFED